MKKIDGYNVKIFTDKIQNSLIYQLKNLLTIDSFSDSKIRIMPDVHPCRSWMVGFTANIGQKIIPNIVGLDIGCGILVIKLGKLNKINYHAFNNHILATIPSGPDVRDSKSKVRPLGKPGMEIYDKAKQIVQSLHCFTRLKQLNRVYNSIGTLGSGNHFIELDNDERGNIYLLIHTGSRNLGKQVANYYQSLAVKNYIENSQHIQKYGKPGTWQGDSHDNFTADMCYLEGKARDSYLHDMKLCQQWAQLNRQLISILLLEYFSGVKARGQFESIHNYIGDDNIVRKGAISAKCDEKCIIAFNMRDGAIICRGKGNADWNNSAPHGAGRLLDRTQAYRKISLKEFYDSMRGIYSECINLFTRDESPMAYKPANEILTNITQTVSIERRLRPIFNFKASSK